VCQIASTTCSSKSSEPGIVGTKPAQHAVGHDGRLEAGRPVAVPDRLAPSGSVHGNTPELVDPGLLDFDA
jgi:hypothetical protein